MDKPWLGSYPTEVIEKQCPEKTMYRFLYDNNANRLDNVAMVYFDRKITYREMFSNIKNAANAFVARGVKEGDIVSIISLNTPETAYCIYALNMIGAVANLIIATSTPQEIIEQLDNTESKMLIMLDKILEKIGSLDCKIPIIVLSVAESAGGFTGIVMKLTGKNYKDYMSYESFLNTIEQSEKIREVINANAPAIIVYTSGSTGTPKGVVLSNNNMNSCAWQCFISGKDYKTHEQFLNILPPFFSFGIGMMHLCFFAGMTEIICIVPQVKVIHKLIQKYRPERLVVGPAITDVVEKYPGKFPYLIDLTGGGGSISLEKERLLNKILEKKHSKSKYISGYGMTELASAVSMNRNDFYKEQSIGLPLPFTNMKVIDIETGSELAYGYEGELLVSAPGIMLGYYKNTAETNAVIEVENGERWLHTGDLARIDEDGYVFITGRLKRIYITKDVENIAYKIFPQRMEEVIEECSIVNKCGVIVVPDEKRQNVPVVFAVIDEAFHVDEVQVKEEIKIVINEKLPSYYLPQEILIIHELPVSSSQKIDYRELEKRYINSLTRRK